tara:strand:- start:794 stop:1033 length:240 start_codon:yes stop_codon:yes gene_type:complete
MKYLLTAITLALVGCGTTLKTFDHPIDPVKAKELVTVESPALSVNLWHVSFMAAIVSSIVIFAWIIGWKKSQKSVADSS